MNVCSRCKSRPSAYFLVALSIEDPFRRGEYLCPICRGEIEASGLTGDERATSYKQPLKDAEFVLNSLALSADKSARVHFFNELGAAIVTTGATATVTSVDLFRASLESGWDVKYYRESEFLEVKRLAAIELLRLKLVNTESAAILIENGIFTLDDVSVLPAERVAMLLNIPCAIADTIISDADEIVATQEA